MTERDPNEPIRGTGAPPPTGGDWSDRAAARPATPPDESPTVAWSPATESHQVAAPAAAPVRPARSGRLRWGVALLVTAIVVVAGAAGFMLLAGQSAPSTVVGYASSDSVAYGEVRLDLPGDQRQQLGAFLSKFPGFADQSTLDAKIDDVLDRIVRAATDDEQDWTTRIKPWFGGEMAFSVGALPPPDEPEEARGLVILSLSDAGKARAWFDDVTADVQKTTTDHNGTEITLISAGDGGAAAEGASAAMAIADDRVMLLGDDASVRAAIDAGGSGSFASNDTFETARASVEGDSLGFMYVDLARYVDWAAGLSEALGTESIPFAELSADLTPEWMLMRAQARGESIAFEVVTPHSEISAADENRAGALADQVPPSTFVLIDAHDYGASFLELIARLRAEPESAEAFEQLDQVLSIVGGERGLFEWMGDAGIAVARDGDGVHGGLVFRPTDRAEAERLLTTLRSFAALGGGSIGVTVRDEDYAGTEMTIIDVGDWRDLAAAGGAAAPGVELPEGRLEIAYAATDDVVVIGIGPSFVRAVLDAGSGPSLADDARYRGYLEDLGATENIGSAFVDVVAVRELLEQLGPMDPDAFAEYERDVKPYLEPLDAFVQAAVRDGDLDRSTLIITVK